VVEGEDGMTHYIDLLRKKMMEVSNGEWKILDEKKDGERYSVMVEYVPKVMPYSLKVRAIYYYSGNDWSEWHKKYYSDVQIGNTKIRVWAYDLEMLFRKLQQLFEVVKHAEVIK
jgi:hypothetical protein